MSRLRVTEELHLLCTFYDFLIDHLQECQSALSVSRLCKPPADAILQGRSYGHVESEVARHHALASLRRGNEKLLPKWLPTPAVAFIHDSHQGIRRFVEVDEVPTFGQLCDVTASEDLALSPEFVCAICLDGLLSHLALPISYMVPLIEP